MTKETIEINIEDFMVIREALLDSINDCAKVGYKQEVYGVNPKTSELVENYTDEQVKLGEVVIVTDKHKTFTPENVFTFYDGEKLTPVMMYAQEKLTFYSYKNKAVISEWEEKQGAN